MSSTPAVPWLEESEMELWRAWLRVQTGLPAAMGRALHADSELSLQDFETLVRLSEAEEGRLRVSALAEQMHWERSRLSHHLRRMGGRGLVEKVECAEDGRGAFVVLTDAGREALEGAAPDHVRTVRRLFFDGMGEAEREVLSSFLRRVVERTS
ncbi:MarR family winged helix-turn-helix transcriptional regulator [Serinicoccus marinus]|uniref:MarR family winged helix-turn-helix transcriptional regulator n=1 Tax=Serinicoccus marinus TaxID=247333 RepID=UPI0003B61DF4|nr:MarR family transcriptional regulator [Serinicoccus marinus]